jgi:hypothetical protein
MDNIMQSKWTILDESSLDESRLCWGDNAMGHWGEPNGIGLRDYLEDHVYQRNGTAPATFGIRVRMPKFSLAISTVPKANPFKIWSTGRRNIGQNFL